MANTLAENDSSKDRVLLVQVYLTDIERDFAGFNEAWDSFWPLNSAPVRATVGTTRLALPGWKVEMVVTAATQM
jgi:2-iminobutanoate/2-iminopropanoate deaminase